MKSSTQHVPGERGVARLARFAPLAGAAFAGLTIGGYLTIGKFPGSDTPVSQLTTYYAANHGRIGAGGLVLACAAICLAFFGVTLAAMIRVSSPGLASLALVGTAVAAAEQLSSASTYVTLGDIGSQTGISAGALQAWHVGGSDGGIGGGVPILMVAVALAAALARVFPRWLAMPGLALGLLQLTPVGFFAWMLFLLWALVAGIVLCRRPHREPRPARAGHGVPST
jgi:hypothetical protein